MWKTVDHLSGADLVQVSLVRAKEFRDRLDSNLQNFEHISVCPFPAPLGHFVDLVGVTPAKLGDAPSILVVFDRGPKAETPEVTRYIWCLIPLDSSRNIVGINWHLPPGRICQMRECAL